jgi:anaerobic magnesium-protoporphyrin IX monomethyl ester cyclase
MIVLTHAYFIHEDEVELKIMKPYVPLGILYLSAFLEDNGVSNLVFDSTFNSKETWKAYMTKNKPSIIAFYTNLITRLNVLELIQWVKVQLPECKIVLGGPEVKHHAAEFLNNGAHIIAIGEGEQTMLELYHTLTGGGNLNDVNGIAFLQNNEIVFTNARALIKDIDALPVPNRKKVSIQLYLDAWKNTHGYSTISLSTMRGCPYSCKWCSRAVYGQSYRRRSPQHVINEIKHLKLNYQFDRIWFVDDVFTISHKWLEDFV